MPKNENWAFFCKLSKTALASEHHNNNHKCAPGMNVICYFSWLLILPKISSRIAEWYFVNFEPLLNDVVAKGSKSLMYSCSFLYLSSCPFRCNVDKLVSRVAWLNRTTILFAGSEKWSLDPRVVLMENTAVTEYSIQIQNVDVHDEGPYVCSILTNKKPKATKVHLIVQGKPDPTLY